MFSFFLYDNSIDEKKNRNSNQSSQYLISQLNIALDRRTNFWIMEIVIAFIAYYVATKCILQKQNDIEKERRSE